MNFDAFVEKIMSRVRLIVSYCTVIASKNSDDGMTVDAEFVPGEKRTGLEFFQQFGFSSRPKGDVDGVALFIGGSRDNGVVVATRDASGQQLEEGEVVVYSAFGSSVKLKKDGTIALSPASGKNVVAESDLLCKGKLLATGDVFAGVTDTGETVVTAGGVSLQMHMHPTAAPGSPSVPTTSA